MNIVIAGAIGAALFVYETVGILGYLSFGDTVGVNILGMCKFLFLSFHPSLYKSIVC